AARTGGMLGGGGGGAATTDGGGDGGGGGAEDADDVAADPSVGGASPAVASGAAIGLGRAKLPASRSMLIAMISAAASASVAQDAPRTSRALVARSRVISR